MSYLGLLFTTTAAIYELDFHRVLLSEPLNKVAQLDVRLDDTAIAVTASVPKGGGLATLLAEADSQSSLDLFLIDWLSWDGKAAIAIDRLGTDSHFANVAGTTALRRLLAERRPDALVAIASHLASERDFPDGRTVTSVLQAIPATCLIETDVLVTTRSGTGSDLPLLGGPALPVQTAGDACHSEEAHSEDALHACLAALLALVAAPTRDLDRTGMLAPAGDTLSMRSRKMNKTNGFLHCSRDLPGTGASTRHCGTVTSWPSSVAAGALASHGILSQLILVFFNEEHSSVPTIDFDRYARMHLPGVIGHIDHGNTNKTKQRSHIRSQLFLLGENCDRIAPMTAH